VATAARRDPYLAFNFLLEIDGLVVAGFADVSGVTVETEVEERTEGGVNDHTHTFVKGTRHPRLVLKRGLTDSDDLWRWHQEVVAGRIARRTGHILLLDAVGAERWRWTFEAGYPVKWTGPDLKAEQSGLAFETLELVHRGLTKG